MNQNEKNYYDAYWSNCWINNQRINAELKEKFTKYIEGSKIVLDLGCGDGRHYSKFLSGITKKLIGFDLSSTAIKSFMQESKASAVIGNAKYNLPFKNDSIDIIIWIENVEHLIYPEIILKEVCRILKKDGFLIITTPNITNITNRFLFMLGFFNPMGSPETSFKRPWGDPHIRFFTIRSLKDFLITNGFEIVELNGTVDRILYNFPKAGKFFKFDSLLIPVYKKLSQFYPGIFSGGLIAVAKRKF